MQTLTFKQRKSSLRWFVISVPLVLLILAALLPAAPQDTNSVDTLRQIGKTFTKIAQKASPAVVSIKAEKPFTQDYFVMPDWPFGEPFDPFGDDFFDRFFRRQSPHRRQRKELRPVQGSGFIISQDGHILTNNHLVGEAEKITVKFADDREFIAKLIGTDPESDVAVIKIDAKKDLPHLQLADSDALEVGEWVIAIGNPFGLDHTVTAGIISAKGRSEVGLATFENYIQTDAAINPGNSGGPLLNLDAEVVGINSAIVSRSGGFVGIGFAIPINMAKAIYKELVDTGKVVRGFLGVNIKDLDPDTAELLGLDKDAKGVVIPDVTKDSAADKAGIKPYDVIVEFDDEKVEKAAELLNRVAALKPGTEVKIVVLRDGKRKTITVELGTRPPREEIIAAPPTDVMDQLGFSVQELTDELAERLGYEGLTGVVVSRVEPGSEAAKKRITRGTLIMEVNRAKVKNVKEFNKAIKKAAEDGGVLLRVKQGRYTDVIALKVPKE
ncbi:MAG: Do family serine endopeptidase [Planctomycetota bacterium]|jgi:serine protease Do